MTLTRQRPRVGGKTKDPHGDYGRVQEHLHVPGILLYGDTDGTKGPSPAPQRGRPTPRPAPKSINNSNKKRNLFLLKAQ